VFDVCSTGLKFRQTDDSPDARDFCARRAKGEWGYFLLFSAISLSLGVGRRDLAVTPKWVVTGTPHMNGGTVAQEKVLRTRGAPHDFARAPIRYVDYRGGGVQTHRGPCRPHTGCKPLLPLKNPRSVVLLCDQHTGVTKQT